MKVRPPMNWGGGNCLPNIPNMTAYVENES